MNFKTTQMRTIIGCRQIQKYFIFPLMLLFFSLFSGSLRAQTLITDSVVPVLDVCAGTQQFTVKIASGTTACPNGVLTITPPPGFELDPASVKVNAVQTAVTGNASGITVNVNVPANSSDIEVTFDVLALCETITSSSTNPSVNYTLNGCGAQQTGTSEVINIRYAVLRVSVTPGSITGSINDEIERTITIRNQGNGEISEFTLDRNLGSGLSHVSYNYTNLTGAGWSVNTSNPNQLVFSGVSLKSGESITLRENVRIISCSALTPTNYEVYYGCGQKCTLSQVNGTTTHNIDLVAQASPSLSVTASSDSPLLNCFNDYGANIWTITNTGSVASNVITFEIIAQGGIDVNSIRINQSNANVVSSTATSAIIQIPALSPNESVTLDFNQYYPAPEGLQEDCASAPTQFTTGQNAYSASFDYPNSCAPVTISGNISGGSTYNYSGIHLGEIEMYSGGDNEFEYLFQNFTIPSTDLNQGDRFEVLIKLAPGLTANASAIQFEGAEVIANDDNNEFRLVFTYGTAPWTSGALNFNGKTLKFPITLNCPTDTTDLWSSIGGALVKVDDEGDDCSAIVFKCNVANLEGYCGDNPCGNGLEIGQARLSRISLGNNIGANGLPIANTVAANTNNRLFITGDILEIHQNSRVIIENGTFTRVKFVVNKSSAFPATLVSNSGKITVTRGGSDVEFDNLSVTDNADAYILEFDVSTDTSIGNAFANNDEIRLSLQIKASVSENENLPIRKELEVASYLVSDSGQELQCSSRPFTPVTGLYISRQHTFQGNVVNFATCENENNSASFSTELSTIPPSYMFSNEYRKMFIPTSVTLEIPHYLELKGVKLSVELPDGWSEETIITGLSSNNEDYSIDAVTLSTRLQEILGTGIDYLNESAVLKITPIVEVFACDLNFENQQQPVKVTLQGSIVDGEGNETDFQNYSQESELIYNTGVGSLTFATSNNNLLGKLNSDGTEVSWVVKVQSEGARNFNSVWFAKNDGELIIKSVEEVANYQSTTGSVLTATNDMYRLDAFAAGQAKYYLIKADVINCEVKSLKLTGGYNCQSDQYPSTIPVNSTTGEGCVIRDIELTHKSIDNILQTEILSQFNDAPAIKPDLCDEIWYSVQLHNGGDSQLDNLKIRIPLSTATGLSYNSKFEYSNVYAASGGSATDWITGIASNVDLNDDVLEISLPNTVELNTLERVQIRVYFKVDNCSFRSGAKHTVTPTAKNTCGTDVTNVTRATTRRLIIRGGSDAFPELRTEGVPTITLDPVLTSGGVLRAVYNAEIKNSGVDTEGNAILDAVTDDYQVALKLPEGWSIVGDPAAYLLPTSKFEYLSLDPVRGYLYQVRSGQTITVGQTIKFNNVPLKYTLSDETSLTCDYNFGEITVSVFQNIPVVSCDSNPDCSGNGIDQVLYENTMPMELPVDSVLTITPEYQNPEICNPAVNGGVPTLADIPFESSTTVYHLDWYENEQEAQGDDPTDRMPLTTPLVDGRTYYVINRFIVDGVCKSNIGKITVTFVENNLQGTVETICSVDNQTYQVSVTLNGDAPYTVTGTGINTPITFNGNTWVSESIVAATPFGAGTPYNFTFTDANNCTPLNLTGVAPMCCDLEIACPADITIACGENTLPARTGQPVTVRACGNTTYTYTDSELSACVNGERTITRTFTVTDEQGNSEQCEQIITILDNTNPVFNEALPKDVTYTCTSQVPTALTLTATDNCGNAVVTFNETIDKEDDACDNDYRIIRTWTATDGCGNTVTHIQTITVQDNIPPSITTNAKNMTVQCDGSGNTTALNNWLDNHAGAIATDNCSGLVTWTNNYDVDNFVEVCGNTGSIDVTFTATDACGNESNTTARFTIEDTTAPVFTGNLPTDVIVSCVSDVPDSIEDVLTASDNCSTSAEIDITVNDVTSNLSTVCENNHIITRTYTATDACGNTATHIQIIRIEDKIKPVFVGSLPQNATYSCDAEVPVALELSATDNCTETPMTVVPTETRVDGSCANSYVLTRTWTATDACGNTATHIQTITVADTSKPVFVGSLPQNVTYSCDAEVPVALELSATDNCAETPMTVVPTETRVDGSCANSYVLTRTWTATDACGNTATHIQTITVADTTKPEFTTDPQNKVVECDGEGNLEGPDGFYAWLSSNAGAVATDNCSDVTITYLIEDTNTICGGAGSIIVDFIAKDDCGNFSIKQAVYMILDRTPPVVTPASNLVIECSINGEDELNAWLSNHGGATATDSCGQITWTHNYQSSLAICGAPILVIFTATDSCGNASTTEATVSVVDTVLPTLTKQAQSLTVQCGTNTTQLLNNWLLNHGGAEAIDSCSTVTWSHNYDEANFVASCGTTGSVEVTFTGSDACGNEITTTATFTIEDTTSPTLVKAAQPKTVECDGSGNMTELEAWLANNGGATATDTCDANITWTNDYDANNFTTLCGGTGSVTVTFIASDACENSVSTMATFTIVDTTKPVFTTEPQNEIVECDGEGNTAAYNAWLSSYGNSLATDNCGLVTYTYSIVDTAVLCGKTSKTTVKFTATDACGNKVSQQATFTIQDTQGPDFITEASELVVECGNDASNQINTWLNNHAGAIATDDCGTVSWSHNYSGLTMACGNTGNALVTFTATDACGNISTTQATVTVVDTIDPVLIKEAQDLIVQCGANTTQALNNWLANHAGAEAIDSCSTITWSHNYDEANFVASCGTTGSVEVIFTGSDACGNEITTTATFTIEDTTSPTLVKAAQPKTVECDGSGNMTELEAWLANHGGAAATDSCDADLIWTNDYDAANFVASCGSTGNVSVTFTATDACNNKVSTTAIFTIIDTTKPVFTTEPQNEVVECDGEGNTAAYNAWLSSYGNSVATDNCGDVVYSHSIVDTVVSCGSTNTRVVNFTATDACGNSVSKQASFIIVDTEGPEFITEAEDLVVECDGTGNNSDLTAWLGNRAGATAQDDCSSALIWTNDFKGLTKDCGNTGTTQVTFTVTDACGNESVTTAKFTIVDTTAPVFNVNLPKDRTIECSDPMPEVAVLTADDLCSKATVSFDEKRIDGDCPNNYELVRTWIASDACGNTVEHVQTITVQDTTAPQFVGELPSTEIFVKCEDLQDAPLLEAVDNCGTVEVRSYDEVIPGGCGDTKYAIDRTWVATDACGNETTFTQTVNVSCKIEVYNAVTPNGDGLNDELELVGIECYPGNTVEIYNRWGVLVYETKDYNSSGNTFKGISNGRAIMSGDSKLPSGTYYYVIRYTYDVGNGESYPIEQAGYLHLENNK